MRNLFDLCQSFLPSILEVYSRTKNVDYFFYYLDIHREFLTIGTNSLNSPTVEEMIQFEKDFAKELEIEHRSIFLWKMNFSRFLVSNSRFDRSSEIAYDLFKQLKNKERFDDVKLELCGLIVEHEVLFEQINESKLENQPDKLKYYSICFFSVIFVKETLMKVKNG